MNTSLRDLGSDLMEERQFLRALGVFAETVRRVPTDHRARMLGARCFVELGERERGVLVRAPLAGAKLGPKGLNLETQAVVAAHDEGIDLPLIDLAMSDPYANATAKVEQGKYFGIATVLGVPCHHLAFTQENVDWQVWIEDGPQPLIRKFVITYKNEPGAPEFTALITHWNLTDRIAGSGVACPSH